jgi:hypothetical protein
VKIDLSTFDTDALESALESAIDNAEHFAEESHEEDAWTLSWREDVRVLSALLHLVKSGGAS